MSEAINNSLTLDALTIGDPISEHHGVKCCPAIRESTDERYIVKFLSIPASQVQLDALLLTGAYPTPAHALEYFRERAEEVMKEVDVLNRLHSMEGFLPFTHAEIRKCEDKVGYQVCLVSPYKRSLARQMQLKPLTHLAAVNLGLDLCAALAICRRAGYLYIDLKPTNVYITPNQAYRISDLGFIPLNSLKYASYPEQYRSVYTAPEITDAMSALNDRIDVYALGLILYQIYNNSELPAEVGGELPPPPYADYEMAEIILKACNPDPDKRWSDPLQMGQAIVAYMQRNDVNDTPIVPPPVEIPEAVTEEPVDQPDAVEESEITDDPGAMLDSILNASAPAEPVSEESEQNVDPEADTEELEAAEDTSAEEVTEATESAPAAEDSEITEDVDAPEDAEPAEDVVAFEDAEPTEDIAASEDTEAAEGTSSVSDEEAVEEIPTLTIPEDDEPVMDLSFIVDLPDDETAPTEESAAEINIDLVSGEVQDMLARADELISHELPEPAVAPEPIDVPFPAPITLSEETGETAEPDASTLPTEDNQTGDAEEDVDSIDETDSASDTDSSAEADDSVEDGGWTEVNSGIEVSEFYSDRSKLKKKKSKFLKPFIIIASCIALLAALVTSGILFYQHYYLQPVKSFTISGSVDSLTVVISSSIKDELLTAVCTDTYGNTRTQEVINGRAHFTNLTPNTQYRVQLSISGFHRLEGITYGSYTTAAQTEILNLTAVAGPEDGSVILSFAVNGPDTDTWTVAYSTGNNPEVTKVFNGHTVTVNDLIVGSEYLFRLIPSEDQYLAGAWMLHYTAQQIVYAQELSIKSCVDGTLVAVWNTPNGSEGQSWNVRCYNDNGYDKTITTTDTQAQFTELDPAYGYTIDVTAIGMTQNATASVTAHPITLTDISVTEDNDGLLTLNWSHTGDAPAEGWVLDYTIDGGTPITVACQEKTTQITRYPGSKYEFDVRPVGEVTYFGQHLSYEVAKPEMFSNYGVSADHMEFRMCLTPNKENWDNFDVPKSDYTETFKPGDKASFLLHLQKNPQKSSDKITITFVIRDENGVPVSLNKATKTWKKMWDNKYCALNIPKMPESAGTYTVDIYFNDQQINQEPLSFSII